MSFLRPIYSNYEHGCPLVFQPETPF